jgi:hypothetical protein
MAAILSCSVEYTLSFRVYVFSILSAIVYLCMVPVKNGLAWKYTSVVLLMAPY